MKGEQDHVRQLAERIARRLSEADGASGATRRDAGDLDDLRAGLSEIRNRLAHIERHISHDASCGQEARENDSHRHGTTGQSNVPSSPASAVPSTMLSGTYLPVVSHPSQERFTSIGEAVSELVEHFEREKTCTIEPGGKPCDQCGACSARGF